MLVPPRKARIPLSRAFFDLTKRQVVMKCYFTDCLRNPFEVECIIKDEIDLDKSGNSNTYTSAVLIFASEQHAICALNLDGHCHDLKTMS